MKCQNRRCTGSVERTITHGLRCYLCGEGDQYPMLFAYCATCGGELDTGWECNKCGRDWRPFAYPWWARLAAKIRRFFER